MVASTTRDLDHPTPVRISSDNPLRSFVFLLALVAAVAMAILVFFLWIHWRRGVEVPIGWDFSKHLWRTNLIQAEGFAGLAEVLPRQFHVIGPARPAFPVLTATLASLGGVGTIRLATVLTGVVAAALGLAAGALCSQATRGRWWAFPVGALAVGTSLQLVLMARYGYIENLMAAAVLMAGLVALGHVTFTRARWPLLAAVFLLGAGLVIHWGFAMIVAAAMGAATAYYLPTSWRSWRSGSDNLLDTPSGRIGVTLTGGGALAGTFLLGPLGGFQGVRLARRAFATKLLQDIPEYRFPVALPLAALGAGSQIPLARRPDVDGRRARLLLVILVAWGAVTLGGSLVYSLGYPIPANRFLVAALFIPVLAVLGVLWLADRARRWLRPAGVAALVAAALAGAVYLSHLEWSEAEAWMERGKVHQAATAAAYLDEVGISSERPVVFVIKDSGPNPRAYVALMRDMIYLALPPERVRNAFMFMGTPEDYLSRQPSVLPLEAASSVSRVYFNSLRQALDESPVALIISNFNFTSYGAWVEEHPETVVGPGVAVLEGPRLPEQIEEPFFPLGDVNPLALLVISAGSVAALGFVGLGWTLLFFGGRARLMENLGIAPAVGIALIVLGGVLADRIGVRLVGLGGALTLLVIGAAGWGLLAAALVRKARRPSADAR